VRTLLKRSSIFEGNCMAGRWNERASCFDSRVLYCTNHKYFVSTWGAWAGRLTNGSCNFWAGYACSTTSWPKVWRTRCRPPSLETS
jgi:hypothetical protein